MPVTPFRSEAPPVIAASATPIVLEGRYRLLVGALIRVRRSRRGRWAAGVGYGATAVVLAALTARHFATTPGRFRAGTRCCWWRRGCSFSSPRRSRRSAGLDCSGRTSAHRPLRSRPETAGAALTGLVLPGRFDDAMRIAVVRRYPGCPAGVRALGPLFAHARTDRRRRPRAARTRSRGSSGRRQRSPHRARGRGRRRRRGRCGDRCAAAPIGERACSALPPRPLVEPPDDVVAPRV